jgi:uncharacterized protein YndB with AHSA1/START domain
MSGEDLAGNLEKVGDTWRLRFVRQIDRPADVVWNAITVADQLERWFPTRIVGEILPGAKLRFEDAAIPTFDGEVIDYLPPSLLELRWGPDVIRFEITPTTSGCTLTFTDTFGEYGKAARDAAGWHECLDVLQSVVSGSEVDWDPGARWAEVHPVYVAKFGPAASTLGPPEGFVDRGSS